jgi:hypothetical protein
MDKNKEAKRQTINLVTKKDQAMLEEDELESMEESENNERLRQFSLRTQNSSFNSPDIERNLFRNSSKEASKNDEIALTSADLKERIGDILKVINFENPNAKDVWSKDSNILLSQVWSHLEEETGSDLSSRKDEIASIFCEIMNEIIEQDDSLKKKDSVTVKTILKAHRKRNAENDMNKNAKRQLIRSEVVDETELNQDPEKTGKVTTVIYHFIVVYSLYLLICKGFYI